jgi:hypothetical protein
MRWCLRRRFLLLLLAIGAMFLIHPVARGTRVEHVLYDLLLSALYLAALLVIFTQRRLRLPAFLFLIPTVVGAWTGYALPGVPDPVAVAALHASAAVFLGLATAIVLRSIHAERTISADSIYGAFCGYLLIGIAFGHLYCIAESIDPGSFRGSEEMMRLLRSEGRIHSLLTYFSLVTLATVGYGDITPGTPATRSLAVVEAVLGQFYVAVFMAELIGKRVAQAVTEQGPEEKNDKGSR